MRVTNSANGTTGHTDWREIDWKRANRAVRNLRQRIFKASKAGDLNRVRSLQKLMLRSRSNTVLAVRRVTQDNAGSKTAGVDRVVVKTPKAKAALVDRLMTAQPWRARPTRRVYIPKSNGKLRPLGIPTIQDRCLQARVKNALEPEWEARFEASSYGFRPGRSAHDALVAIWDAANAVGKRRWVVDADIEGAFDNIDHDHLLRSIANAPGHGLVRQWLKAGYLDGGVRNDTDAGTPQGGVISPLLANIALHGMEQALGVRRHATRGTIANSRYAVVRYADDFVVLCGSREDAERAVEIIRPWLAERGLRPSEDKTRIVNTEDGFDFLGFNCRLYSDRRAGTGVKLLIKPSKDSVKRLRKKIAGAFVSLQGTNAEAVVAKLNPIIRGWANYFRPFVSAEVFSSLDNWMFGKTYRWATRRHPTKSWRNWVAPRYFGKMNPGRDANWVFGDPVTGHHLHKFSWVKIKRHVRVKGASSPDDASLRAYFAERSIRFSDLSPSLYGLARAQRFRCPVCGESVFNGEVLHRHHAILDKANPERNAARNQRLVHKVCHQQVHGTRGSDIPSSARELLFDARSA